MPSDKILKALEHVRENPNSTEEMIRDKTGIESADFNSLASGAFFHDPNETPKKYRLSFEGLLAYAKLKDIAQAREGAARANRLAWGAIIIASVLGCLSIMLTLWARLDPVYLVDLERFL